MGVLITIVAFLVLITIVVVVHEGGHYTLAKLSGIRVDEFFVGFGPRVVSFRRGDRIAQLIIQRVERVRFHEAESLPGSARADGGFGSTGGHAASVPVP